MCSPRGSIQARIRIGGIRDGVLFIPFHYGYWDVGDENNGHDWDPMSKQPIFKTGSAPLAKVASTQHRHMDRRAGAVDAAR